MLADLASTTADLHRYGEAHAYARRGLQVLGTSGDARTRALLTALDAQSEGGLHHRALALQLARTAEEGFASLTPPDEAALAEVRKLIARLQH